MATGMATGMATSVATGILDESFYYFYFFFYKTFWNYYLKLNYSSLRYIPLHALFTDVFIIQHYMCIL
jgi:hypothetical protein